MLLNMVIKLYIFYFRSRFTKQYDPPSSYKVVAARVAVVRDVV